MAKRHTSEIEQMEEVEVTFLSKTNETKRAKIEKAHDCARKEIEEIPILLKATTQKVKILR